MDIQLSIFDMIQDGGDEMDKQELSVRRIERKDAEDFILNKHYAKRWAPISYTYGLFRGYELIGVCTIGKPPSPALCEGLLGKEYKSVVYELNRLITIDNLEKNTLSFFVGQVLKDIKKEDLVLVSYADTSANHCGYIYQATNWIYTGTTKVHYDNYVPNGKHPRSVTKEELETYKDLRRVRSVKHRYIYFACNKRLKRDYMRLLKYPIIGEYPKEDNKKYVLGERIKYKVVNKVTGETWYE